MEVKNPQRRVLRMKCSTKSVETTKAAVEEKVDLEQSTNASVEDAPQHVDMFMSYHEDAENYRHQPENFETVYSILDQYANEDENPENMDVQDLFVRMPLEKQELVMDLINPDNWKASGRQRHPLNGPEERRMSPEIKDRLVRDNPFLRDTIEREYLKQNSSRQLVKNVVTGETAIYVPDSAQPELPAGWVPMNSAKQMTKDDIIRSSTATLKSKGPGSKKVDTDASLEGESMYDNPTLQREALNSALKPDQEHRVIGIAKVYDHYYGSMDERQIEDFLRRKMETYAPDAHVYIYHVGPGQLEITIEADNPKDLRNAKFAIDQSKAIESVEWQKPTNAGCHGKRATDASVSGEKVYRVWYEPYGYQGEEDFMDVHAGSEEEARYFVGSSGLVSEVEEINGEKKELNASLPEDTLSFTVQMPTTDRAWAEEMFEDIADSFYYDDYLSAFFLGPEPGTIDTYLTTWSNGCTITFEFSSLVDANRDEIESRVNDILSNYDVQVTDTDMY